MSKAIENLESAQQRAMAIRPKVGGFPYLAEVLRQAGITRNFWFLPACESLYLTNDGPVVTQGTPLVSGTVDYRFRPRGAYPGHTNRPGRRQHFPRLSGILMASRSRALRCRFRGAYSRLLWMQRRTIRRELSCRRSEISITYHSDSTPIAHPMACLETSRSGPPMPGRRMSS